LNYHFGKPKERLSKIDPVIKMNAKKHYENYWGSKKSSEEFKNYERNWYLTNLFVKGQKILDLGCGDGAVAEYLMKIVGACVVGADISEDALEKAKKRGIDVKLLNVEKSKLPFEDKTFDAVFWGDNVEHLFDPAATLKEVKRVLKKEGSLVISCPNMGYFRYRIYYFLHGALPDTEWTGLSPWAWSHIRFFNLKILNRFLRSEGLFTTKTVGVSKRFPGGLLAKIFPSLFGMILLVEAKKI
jgi:methionine biosynthesis protein MetW